MTDEPKIPSPDEAVVVVPDPLSIRDAMRDVAVEEAVANFLHDAGTNLSIKTVARVKAAIETYAKVYSNFSSYMVRMSEDLQRGMFGEKEVFKEVSVARLVAQFLTDTERFIDENENLLKRSSQTIRQGYIEGALAALPVDLREELMLKLQARRQEMAEWLTQELQRATMVADGRRMAGG